jgi:voltage-gated potassium channel
MPILLARLFARLGILRGWAVPVVVFVLLIATSWPLMILAEGPSSEIVQPANFWWWFIVTASTVGYGDFYPATAFGHAIGAYVIIGGIVTLTTIFTNLAVALESARGRRMQGAITVDATDHLVLIGYSPGRTERIADEMIADDPGRRVVLCTGEEVPADPMRDRDIQFVRGDLADCAVLRRAGVHRAATVLVDLGDDNEALAITLTVGHLRTAAHVVVTLRDMARAKQVGYVDPAFSCVQWYAPHMVTEELQSPGIADVYADLMSHGGADTFSTTLPASLGPVRFGDCQVALGRQHRATVLAMRTGDRLTVNPPWDAELSGATVLYYVAGEPLTPERIAEALRNGVPQAR